jgi:hypothetical protein
MVLLFSASGALLLAACGDNPSGGEVTDLDYFPHTVGSWWQFEKYGEVDTLGLTFQLTGDRLTTVTSVLEQSGVTIIEMTNIGLDSLLLDGVDTIPVPLAPKTIARLSDEGIWLYSDSTMQDSTWWVRFPLEVGSTWISHPDPEIVSEVVSMDVEMTVPDGTFQDVLHIRATSSNVVVEVVWDYYFAPYVGNIAGEITGSSGGTTTYSSTEELVNHLTL